MWTKTIMHIDFDSFFASVEQQVNPLLRGKPISVGGSSLTKGIVCAASREAKKFGIKTAMPIYKARQLCPQLISVRGDFTKYQYIHKRSLEIFNKYTNLVEPFSIDECFLDVTETLGSFGSAQNIACLIKSDFCQEFGECITCSIGIAHNKLMAKLVSDFNKPDGLYIVTKENLDETLRKAKLRDFCGIGYRIEARLNALGVFTVEQLQNTSVETLYKEFGNEGSKFLKNLSFGIGNETVHGIEYKSIPKSIGHQHTLSKNTSDLSVLKNNLRRLAGMAGRRLRKKNMMGKTIICYVRDADMKGDYLRKTLDIYTNSSAKIYKVVEELLETMIKNKGGVRNRVNFAFEQSEKGSGSVPKKIRLVAVTVSNLIPAYSLPAPLFAHDKRIEQLIQASDKVNDRYGEFTLVPANTLLADKTKGKISSFLRH